MHCQNQQLKKLGLCHPVNLLAEGQLVSENLQCIICYQVMTKPVKLPCKVGHIFGLACIQEWLRIKGHYTCPYCKEKVSEIFLDEALDQDSHKLTGFCRFCQKFEGSLLEIELHHLQCGGYKDYLENQLSSIVELERKQLSIQINPHLSTEHSEIFEEIVKQWEWLQKDKRDWKWWWWAEQPWWKEPCNKCLNLSMKFDKKMNMLDLQRVGLIEKIHQCQKSE